MKASFTDSSTIVADEDFLVEQPSIACSQAQTIAPDIIEATKLYVNPLPNIRTDPEGSLMYNSTQTKKALSIEIMLQNIIVGKTFFNIYQLHAMGINVELKPFNF